MKQRPLEAATPRHFVVRQTNVLHVFGNVFLNPATADSAGATVAIPVKITFKATADAAERNLRFIESPLDHVAKWTRLEFFAHCSQLSGADPDRGRAPSELMVLHPRTDTSWLTIPSQLAASTWLQQGSGPIVRTEKPKHARAATDFAEYALERMLPGESVVRRRLLDTAFLLACATPATWLHLSKPSHSPRTHPQKHVLSSGQSC